MFEPELKNTGWSQIEETVFEITGENFRVYDFHNNYEEINNGYLVTRNLHISHSEAVFLNKINNSIINIIWEPITASELKDFLYKKIHTDENEIIKFRIIFEAGENGRGDIIYGWIHYLENKKIKTLRFSINLDGTISKC